MNPRNPLLAALALVCAWSMLTLCAVGQTLPTTPSQLQTQINAIPWTNNSKEITGAQIQNLMNGIVNVFQSTPQSFQNFGAICDGSSSHAAVNDAAMTAAIAALGQGGSNTLVFNGPNLCVITCATYWTLPGALSFQGVNGGGLQCASGATIAGSLFKWTGSSGAITVSTLIIDLNGAGTIAAIPRKNFAILLYGTGQSYTVADSQIINANATPIGGNGLTLVAGYGTIACEIRNNRLAFLASSPYINQTIVIAWDTNHNLSNNCKVHGNTHVNAGMTKYQGTDYDIYDETITGTGFGAGVGVGDGFDALSPVHGSVHNINCHDTGTVPDENATKVQCIQIWDTNVNIYDNLLDGTCGPGISLNATAFLVDNHITRSGTCSSQTNPFEYSSIALQAGPYTNPAGSVIAGTTGGNDGLTQYCISDLNTVGPYTIGPNNCWGTQGAYNLQSQATFSNPSLDNLVLNSCFEIDQRNNGAVQTAFGGSPAGQQLWAADQWHYALYETGLSFQRLSSGQYARRCQYAEDVVVVTPHAPPTGDVESLFQNIPVGSLRNLDYGQNTAKSLLFGFCAQTALTPPVTFAWALQNLAGGASYVGKYIFNPTNGNEECFSFVIPGDTNHYIPGASTANGMRAVFDLGYGATYQTPTPFAWTTGASYATVAGVHQLVAGTANDKLIISDVRLQVIGADQGWGPAPYAQVFQGVLPYYQTSFPSGTSPASGLNAVAGSLCALSPIAGAEPSVSFQFSPPMATVPQVWGGSSYSAGITTYNPGPNANANWYDETGSADVGATVPSTAINTRGFLIGTTASVAQAHQICAQFTADAGL